MRPSCWKMVRRGAAALLVSGVCCFALAVPALASDSGETWLNWVYEPKGAGVHAKLYYHLVQTAAKAWTSDNVACTNFWLGYQGGWYWGHDYCVPSPSQAATPRLSDQSATQAFPWAQSQTAADYLWGWALYCNSC